jgi:hypothetical protein
MLCAFLRREGAFSFSSSTFKEGARDVRPLEYVLLRLLCKRGYEPKKYPMVFFPLVFGIRTSFAYL